MESAYDDSRTVTRIELMTSVSAGTINSQVFLTAVTIEQKSQGMFTAGKDSDLAFYQ